MFPDDTPTTDGARPDRRTTDTETTRRSVLQTGLTAGVAATAFGGLTVTAAGAQSDDGPEAPTDLRAEWNLGGPVGLAWDWPEERCETTLSHFEVAIEDSAGRSEQHEIPPEQHAFQTTTEAEETVVSVHAVDEQGRTSDAVEKTLPAIAVDPGHVLRPGEAPDTFADGPVGVPVELLGATDLERLFRYEIEVSVRAPCVATIEDVSLPDDLGLELLETEWADDGSSVRIVAEGDASGTDVQSEIAQVEVAGQAQGGTVLDVTDEQILFFQDDWQYEDWEQYQAAPSEFPDDVGFGDLFNEVDALDRWVTVAVDGTAPPPAPPENVRGAWDWGGQRGVAWDWPGDRCDPDLSHFEIVVDGEDTAEEYEVPSQQRGLTVEPLGAETTVSVRAVGTDGQGSAPAQETFLASAVDPRYEISPASAPTVSAGRTTTVPVELRRVGGEHEDLVGYDLELSVGAPCVARIADVTLPEESSMEVVDLEVTTDGSIAWLTVEGAPPEAIDSLPLAHVELFGVEAGGTVLEVVDNSLRFLADDRDYSEYRAYQEDPSTFPDDVDYSDFRVEDGAIDRWKSVSVDGPAPPAPPENLRTGYWISTSVGLTWDWQDGVCDDRLSHFEVGLYDAPYPEYGNLVEQRTVPAERPTTTVDTSFDFGETEGEAVSVAVRAVDEDGRRSEKARKELYTAIADPGHVLSPSGSPTIEVGEAATVPVDLGAVLGRELGVVRYELDLVVRGPCVATISDVAVPRADWEIVDAEWADDDSSVSVVAEGPPPQDDDYHVQDLVTVDVVGESVGETVLDVRAGEILALQRGYYYEDYQDAKLAEERDVDIPELNLENMTEPLTAVTDTRTNVTVHPPTVVGESPPQDVDGDGLYRDVSGDGSVTNADVTAFFRNQHTSVVDDYPDAYDFTGDGEVGQADVIDLFESLGS